jgi:yecA family protein
MSQPPDYDHLQQALIKAEGLSAAEAHGLLCGMHCAAGRVGLDAWLAQVFEELDLNNLLVREACQQLVGLHVSTQQQLNDPEAGFSLLLPDDEVSLMERTDALAEWCQGFVYGLAAGGLKQASELPPDTAELLADLVQIARVGVDDGSMDEADEDAYMQLCEYVRMGVLLINEELQPLPTTHQLTH